MKRKTPELKKIICEDESWDNSEFLFSLKRGLMLALVERGILNEMEYECAEEKLRKCLQSE